MVLSVLSINFTSYGRDCARVSKGCLRDHLLPMSPPPAVTLFSCFAVTLGCGTLYAFSAFAPQLSDRLPSLDASKISMIAMVGNFAMAFSGPFAGVIIDKTRVGTPVCIITSIVCSFSGYLLVLLCYKYVVASVPLLALALLLIGTGCTCAFSASVKCAAVNFPHMRGTATATTMSGYGLSAFAMSLLAQLTDRKGSDNTEHILMVLTIVPTTLMCVFGPVVIRSQPKKHRAIEEYGMPSMHSDTLVDRVAERHHHEKEISGFKVLKQPIFFVYVCILGLLSGMGQSYIYTCGYIVKALVASVLAPGQELTQGIVTPIQAHQVAILSLANCTGRLVSGTISDTLRTKLQLSRIYALFLSVTLCGVGMTMCKELHSVDDLWSTTVVVGLFYGTVFGAFPGIISDSFGVKCLSSNWGLVALAPIPATSFLAPRIGKLYDASADASGKCVGPVCFAGAFNLHIILTFVTFGLVVAALILNHRDRTH